MKAGEDNAAAMLLNGSQELEVLEMRERYRTNVAAMRQEGEELKRRIARKETEGEGEKSMTETKQAFWGLIELMGHAKIAGLVSEVEMGGAKLLRVDVPDTPEQQPQGWRDAFPAIPAYTRFVGGAAIYAITPMSEEACRALIASLRIDPVYVVGMHHIERVVAGESPKQLAAGMRDVDEEDSDECF